MRTFTIDTDNNITVFASTEKLSDLNEGTQSFADEEEWRVWQVFGQVTGWWRSGTAGRRSACQDRNNKSNRANLLQRLPRGNIL